MPISFVRTLRHTTLVALSLAAVALPPSTGAAQGGPPPELKARAQAALAPLAWLVGTWEGDASAMVGRNQTKVVRQFEDVSWGAAGTVLIVRGTGRSTDAADAGAIVFEAAATIWFDTEQGKLRMRTHRDGGSVEPEVLVKGDTIVWGFPVQGGRVRYTIAHTEGVWHEVGVFLREGAPPITTVEMRLRRTTR